MDIKSIIQFCNDNAVGNQKIRFRRKSSGAPWGAIRSADASWNDYYVSYTPVENKGRFSCRNRLGDERDWIPTPEDLIAEDWELISNENNFRAYTATLHITFVAPIGKEDEMFENITDELAYAMDNCERPTGFIHYGHDTTTSKPLCDLSEHDQSIASNHIDCMIQDEDFMT